MSGREMRKALSVNSRSLKWALIELIGDDDDEAVVQDPSTVTLENTHSTMIQTERKIEHSGRIYSHEHISASYHVAALDGGCLMFWLRSPPLEFLCSAQSPSALDHCCS